MTLSTSFPLIFHSGFLCVRRVANLLPYRAVPKRQRRRIAAAFRSHSNKRPSWLFTSFFNGDKESYLRGSVGRYVRFEDLRARARANRLPVRHFWSRPCQTRLLFLFLFFLFSFVVSCSYSCDEPRVLTRRENYDSRLSFALASDQEPFAILILSSKRQLGDRFDCFFFFSFFCHRRSAEIGSSLSRDHAVAQEYRE